MDATAAGNLRRGLVMTDRAVIAPLTFKERAVVRDSRWRATAAYDLGRLIEQVVCVLWIVFGAEGDIVSTSRCCHSVIRALAVKHLHVDLYLAPVCFVPLF